MSGILEEGEGPAATASLAWTSFVSHWSVWDGAADLEASSGPNLPNPVFIDAMQRRRLSSLAKVSLHVMQACAQHCDDFQVVYASRHGELTRTTDLLNQLAQRESVSPLGFSLAVLNATAGIYSIARKNNAPCSAVSAGADTFAMGWLEAALQARTANCPVLFVYADEPAPEIYGACAQTTGPLHAVALLLHGGPGPQRRTVCCSLSDTGAIEPAPSAAFAPALAFARHWSELRQGSCSSNGRTLSWSWT